MSMKDFVTKVSNLGYVWPDAISVVAALGRASTPEERALWRKLMHNCYTPMALSAGYAIFGRQLTLKDAAHINRTPQAWRERALEARGLSPLLKARVSLELPPSENLKQLRDGLLNRGLASFTWKWLHKQRLSVGRMLFANGASAEAVSWANMFARAKPEQKLSAKYLESSRLYDGQPLYWLASAENSPTTVLTQVERLCRLLPEDATDQDIEEATLLTQAVIVGFREGDMPFKISAGSTWKNLLAVVRARNRARDEEAARLYLERTQAQAHEKAQQDALEGLTWSAKFSAGNLYGVDYEELTSHKELVIEGLAMNHCLKEGGYTLNCARGISAILKMREPVTGRGATLQLIRSTVHSDKWDIVQLQSYGNSTVPMIFWKVAREVVRLGGLSERKAA